MELIAQIDVTPDYLAAQGLSATFPKRFWSRVFITPTHWLWEGARRSPMNHGIVWRGVRRANGGDWQAKIYAHVASWILNRGPIPKGKWVLHRCPGRHVAWCVNPDHLYLGTAKDNTRDIIEQGKMYLCKGHNHSLKGEANPNCKLTQQSVDAMRDDYLTGLFTQWDLARKYGVNQATVSNILLHKMWA